MSTPIPAAMADDGQLELEWDDQEGFPPGARLATFLSSEKNRLADLTDGELLEVAAAARRQTSWAQARELAAIGELARRRTAEEETGDPDYRILSARESVTEEVAAALTLTGNTAATLVHLAEQLTGPLAKTGQALETGRVDLAKARIICDVTEHLPAHTTQRLQDAALEKAPQQTTGQLRRRLRRIAQRLAPQAIEERRREAVRRRRLEVWDTPSGTSDLALCDLTAEDAHAIYNKITAAANGIKADGDPRPLTTIRADLATQLLHGAQLPQAIQTLLTTTPQPAEQHTTPDPALTPSTIPTARTPVPATARATADFPNAPGQERENPAQALGETRADGGSDAGSAAAESLVPREDQALAALVVMVGRELDHLRARVHPAELPRATARAVERIAEQLAPVRNSACQGTDDVHGNPGHRPPAALRREVQARHATWPGLLVWVTPSGAWYIVKPDRQ